ncbi:MAG TPA: tyrosinase family protein [Actinomycetota bacterium]|nr:tyrosinase family protein [Actinomycetota bacterium]
MSTQHRTTRHARFKEIMDAAAGDARAGHGGAGRFWELPIEELLVARIDGVPLVAPPQKGRGAASALVKGLRGEAPFDGTRFPRLPWGGTPVPDDAIDFISEWIDDGLPADDREVLTLPVIGQTFEPVLEEIRPDNVEEWARRAPVDPGEYAHARGEIKQRMNVDCMSAAQIDELRNAMRELYALNNWPEDRRSYNNLALIHLNHCQHGWERFLPWHRIYLYEFEQALQDVSPGVTVPYWDWTMPQYRPDRPQDGWIIPKSFQAFITGESIAVLENANPPVLRPGDAEQLRGMVGETFASQRRFFDRVRAVTGHDYSTGDARNRFIDALLAANALWYPLRYPAEYTGGKTINEVIHYHYPKPEDIEEIMSLRSFRDFGGGSLYNDSFGFIDQNPHNTLHLWTGGMNPDFPPSGGKAASAVYDRNRTVDVAGRRFHTKNDLYSQPQFGDMFSNLTASYDPIFWPVHANVDRLWHEWEQINPQAQPEDLDAVLTPWSYTIRDTLDSARFGYEYVKSMQVLPVGLEAPVGRFVSGPLEVPEPVRTSFRKAEVRLQRVPQLRRSCFVRVFLNVPDANASTPIDHPGYAGYLAIFGHGACYGGPGHCDIPPRFKRAYDLRPRSHDTPRNHRVNVTQTARRLIDGGVTALQITLVVIGADYREDNDVLRLEATSLSFLD